MESGESLTMMIDSSVLSSDDSFDEEGEESSELSLSDRELGEQDEVMESDSLSFSEENSSTSS